MMTNAEKIAEWRESNPTKQINERVLLGLLGRTSLRGVCLNRSNLAGADLRRLDLRDVNLNRSNLAGTDISHTALSWSYLAGANLAGAHLTGTNLAGAHWSGLIIEGLPSGSLQLLPTPAGWEVSIGCWGRHTLHELEALTKSDSWPQAQGKERERRRPVLKAVLAQCRAHADYHSAVIADLARYWGAAA